MKQKWQNLFFLHWEYDRELIQERIPKEFRVDTFKGKAYLAVVGLHMSHIRPNFFPETFNVFNLNELNLRTYVMGPGNIPGVYFFTLECDHLLARLVAQRIFKLPYRKSFISYNQDKNNFFYKAQKEAYRFDFEFSPTGNERMAESSAIEHFLFDRYHYFTNKNNDLYAGYLTHKPYIIEDINLRHYTTDLFGSNLFKAPTGGPVHGAFSRELDITTLSFKKL